MTTVTDDFNRSNGALGGNYTRGQGTASTLSISGNAVAVTANSSDAYERYTGESFGNDQEAWITIGASVASNARYAQVCARASGQDGTFTAYVVLTDGTAGADHSEIGQIIAGSYSRLKAISTTFSASNKLGIRVTGSNPVLIEFLKNTGSGPIVIDSYSDSAGTRISSGGTIGPGGYNSGGSLTLDDFTGGDYSSGGGVPTITDAGDESFRVGETGLTLTGTNFGATQGTGSLRVCPSDDVEDANGVNLTVTAWSDTGISFDIPANLSSDIPRNSNVYLFVVNDAGSYNEDGYVVQITPPPAVLASLLLLN